MSGGDSIYYGRQKVGKEENMSIQKKENAEKEDVFVAPDGKEFESEIKARDYEREINQKKKEAACASFRQEIKLKGLQAFMHRFQYNLRIERFYIKNEEELRRFCEAYYWWDRKFCQFEDRKKGNYPKEYFLFDWGDYFFATKECLAAAIEDLNHMIGDTLSPC